MSREMPNNAFNRSENSVCIATIQVDGDRSRSELVAVQLAVVLGGKRCLDFPLECADSRKFLLARHAAGPAESQREDECLLRHFTLPGRGLQLTAVILSGGLPTHPLIGRSVHSSGSLSSMRPWPTVIGAPGHRGRRQASASCVVIGVCSPG